MPQSIAYVFIKWNRKQNLALFRSESRQNGIPFFLVVTLIVPCTQRTVHDSQGHVASVSTFNGCLTVLDTASPLWALFENVESIDREVDDETQLASLIPLTVDLMWYDVI